MSDIEVEEIDIDEPVSLDSDFTVEELDASPQDFIVEEIIDEPEEIIIEEIVEEAPVAPVKTKETSAPVASIPLPPSDSLTWFSGNPSDAYKKISALSASENLAEAENIHINSGISAYGWNVMFDNGMFMSVKDLQTFQRRSGKLPSSKGAIYYGAKKFEFNNAKRIVMYEEPQYVKYGSKS